VPAAAGLNMAQRVLSSAVLQVGAAWQCIMAVHCGDAKGQCILAANTERDMACRLLVEDGRGWVQRDAGCREMSDADSHDT
jgi:hypothetical protein